MINIHLPNLSIKFQYLFILKSSEANPFITEIFFPLETFFSSATHILKHDLGFLCLHWLLITLLFILSEI